MYEELELIRMGVPYSEAVGIVHYCRKDSTLQDAMKTERENRLEGSPNE